MIYDTKDTELKFKKLFATALMRNPQNPFACAREIEVDETKVRMMAVQWPTDPDIAEYRRELMATRGVASKVPSKEEFAVTVYEEMQGAKDDKTKLAFMQFFARVMGYIDNEKAGVNINVGGGGKIMAVPIAASDDDWERAAKAHQARLVNG